MIQPSQVQAFDLHVDNSNSHPRDEPDRLSSEPQMELDHFQDSDELTGPTPNLKVASYDSLFDLREKWKRLDVPDGAMRLTVLLLLGETFQGHLPGLIRRRNPALRLLIASASGRIPGLISVGDLSLHSASLGWHLIDVYRQIPTAISAVQEPLTWNERCVIFHPTELDLSQLIDY